MTALKEADAYPAMPEDGYGWEKLFSERMCRHFREDFGLRDPRRPLPQRLRPARHLGRRPREGAGGHLPQGRRRRCISGKHEIEIWGDGQQTRSFMYIDDCVKGTQMIMNSDVIEPLNLGSSELVSINQLVDIVEDIAGIKLQRTLQPRRPQGRPRPQQRQHADPAAVRLGAVDPPRGRPGDHVPVDLRSAGGAGRQGPARRELTPASRLGQ